MQTKYLIAVDDFCVKHNIEISFVSSLQQTGMIELTIIEEKFQQYNWRKNLENGYFIIENSHKRLITIKDINLEQEIKIISKDGEQLYKIEKSSN